MKSKQDDAKLIAEAYAQVEPLEVQEEMLGALAAGAGAAARGLGTAARATGRALASEPAKKIYRGAGKAVKTAAETAGGAALGAAGGAAAGVSKAVGGIAQGAIEGTVGAVQGAVDGATGGIGAAARGAGENLAGGFASDEEGDHDAPKGGIRPMEREELKAKIDQALAKGHIDSGDAAQIIQSHEADVEDAEHAAPEEVDMSENPAPESLEVSKEVEEPDAVAIVVPSSQPSIEGERVNHEDDSEMQMAKAELYKLEQYSFKLSQMLDHLPSLEGWTASKITKAADYLGSVYHKLDYDLNGGKDAAEDGE